MTYVQIIFSIFLLIAFSAPVLVRHYLRAASNPQVINVNLQF
jgi:hypothetical protein